MAVNAKRRHGNMNNIYPHKVICPVLRNLVEKGGGTSLFFSGDIMQGPEFPQNGPIFKKILQNWKKAMVDSDLELIEDWLICIEESKGYPLPDGTEWTPGYEVYEEVIEYLSQDGRGLKRKLWPLRYFAC